MKSNINIPCLHEDEKIFKELINLASVHFGVVAEQVEKDYWITRMLKQLEQSRYKDNVYFKGGTCLFKAYGIIKRFSEDLDLYIDTNNPNAGGDPERKLNGEIYHFLIGQNENIHCDNPNDPDAERDFKEAIILKDTDTILNDNLVKAAYMELSNLLIDKESNSLPTLFEVGNSIKLLKPIILRVQQQRKL